MLEKVLSCVAISIGMVFLVVSLFPVYKIALADRNRAWRVLIALILFFIIAYGFFFTNYFLATTITLEQIVLPILLFFGAMFVALVTKLAGYSIEKNTQIAQQERHQSLHDELTGLANRKYLLETLNQHLGIQKPFALFFIDVNNFKHINDGLGHYFGDSFLVSIAQRMQQAFAKVGQVYRIGGDEFAIVYPHTDRKQIEDFAAQLHQSLHRPIVVNNHPMKVSVSVGISKYPKHGEDAFSLLKQADLAMYEAKRKQCDVAFYDPELSSEAYEKLNLIVQLTEALRYSEFELYYQPIVHSADGSLDSYEVLIRWPQTTGGFIAPDRFIPVAEQSSLILAITHWVINQAVMDLQRLRQRGFSGALHINLSAKDLHSEELVGQIDTLMASGQLQAGDLKFEITEGAMFEDMNHAKKVINAIHSRGFDFSIDDFGTGFSSMTLLRELPIKQIKIDRSFIARFFEDEASCSIVYSILSLAQDLHCSVVAEGIENQEIQRTLHELHCDYLQGYFFSRPVPLSLLPFDESESQKLAELDLVTA